MDTGLTADGRCPACGARRAQKPGPPIQPHAIYCRTLMDTSPTHGGIQAAIYAIREHADAVTDKWITKPTDAARHVQAVLAGENLLTYISGWNPPAAFTIAHWLEDTLRHQPDPEYGDGCMECRKEWECPSILNAKNVAAAYLKTRER